MILRELIFLYRHKKACRELQRRTAAAFNAPATVEYRRRREAALSATRKGQAQ
jgi:hypothetical protein